MSHTNEGHPLATLFQADWKGTASSRDGRDLAGMTRPMSLEKLSIIWHAEILRVEVKFFIQLYILNSWFPLSFGGVRNLEIQKWIWWSIGCIPHKSIKVSSLTQFASCFSNTPSEKSMLQDINARNQKKISAVFNNRWLNDQEVIWTPFVFSSQHLVIK